MREIEIDLDVHRAIEAARDSFEQAENDILRKLLGLGGNGTSVEDRSAHASQIAPINIESAIPVGQRKTGDWSVDFDNTRYIARNLREAYITAIDCLASKNPQFLSEFAKEGVRRKFAAREAEHLYPNSPHLAASRHNNWHRISGWFVDLNIGADQAAKRIRRACALSGLQYGRDLVVREGLSPL